MRIQVIRYFVLTGVLVGCIGCQANDAVPRLASYLFPQHIGSLAFIDGGKTLVTASDQGLIQFWDVASERLLPTHLQARGPVARLCASRDGHKLLAYVPNADDDPQHQACLQLWDIPSGKEIVVPQTKNPMDAILSPDGSLMAIAPQFPPIGARAVQIWDVRRCVLLGEISVIVTGINRIWGFTWDSKTLLSSKSNEGLTAIHLWDMDSRKERAHWAVSGFRQAVAATSDRHWLAVWTREGCQLHRLDTGLTYKVTNRVGVNGLAFTPDDQVLVAAWGANSGPSADAGELIFWDVAKQKRFQRMVSKDQRFETIAVSPDGSRLATTAKVGAFDQPQFRIHLWPIPKP